LRIRVGGLSWHTPVDQYGLDKPPISALSTISFFKKDDMAFH
jgi:hypothetical protein